MTRSAKRRERRMRRLHRLVQRLHAPRHERRHRAAIESLLVELLRAAPDDAARAAVLRRAVRDGLGTLWRSWRDELRHRFPAAGARAGWDSLRVDLAFALRFHRRRPTYALLTIVTLALAVGANTAIYSVARAALFRTLPYEAPDRIVELRAVSGLTTKAPDGAWRPSEILATADGIAAAGVYVAGGGANLGGDAPSSRLRLTQVSNNFFEIMGVDLALGAGFAATGEADVAVIGHSAWTQAFGADPAVLGSTIRLSGSSFRVVGVAPPEVDFPAGTEVWIPQPLRWDFYSDAVGPTLIARLAPGIDRAQAEALLAARRQADRPRDDEAPRRGGQGPRLTPLRDALTEGVRAPLLVLLGAAAMVFLLGCLNLAGVAVSRLLRRSGELRIRAALGAQRARVLRQLVVEALLLGVLGGAAGLAVAAAGVRLLLAWLPGDVPGLSATSIGPDSILLAAVLATCAALLINTLPAIRIVRPARVDVAARTATEGRHQARLRSVLAVAQVFVAFLLLVSAGLLGRSLFGLARTPLGIDVDSVLTFEVHVNPAPPRGWESEDDADARRRARRDLYLDQVLQKVASIPGVEAVGAASSLPLSSDMGVLGWMRRRDVPEAEIVYPLPVGVAQAGYLEATTDYFDAIGITFAGGRSFSYPIAASDSEIVVSHAVAESLFGTPDAAGRPALLNTGGEWTPVTIVGVVEEVRLRGPETEPTPTVYGPLRDSADARMGFAVRSAGDPHALTEQVIGALAEVDPGIPPFNVQSPRQALSRQLSARQALAAVSGLFAVTALVLAALGIYGLIAEAVTRRRREIGIRIALGAPIRTVVRRVATRGLILTAAGIAIALPVAFQGASLLDDVLHDVSPRDPWVLIATPAFLFLIAALAAWVPATRAARVDPVEILSAE